MLKPNPWNIDITALPSLPLARRREFPECCAVYFAIAESGDVLYIGHASSLRFRWRQHHRMSQLEQYGKVMIAWYETEIDGAQVEESTFIKKFQPPLNGSKVERHSGLTMVATLLPPAVVDAVKTIAEQEDRSVSQVIKRLVMQSPSVQAALNQGV